MKNQDIIFRFLLILFVLLILSPEVWAFRLGMVVDEDGADVASKALVRWNSDKKKNLKIGTDGSSCDSISNTADLVKGIINHINSLQDSSLNLIWEESAEGHDVTIINHNGERRDGVTLGLATFSATCTIETECNITTATVDMFCDYLANGVAEGLVDYSSVLLHEIVHTVGLDHTPEEASIMYPYLEDNTTAKNSLAQDDEAGLSFLYPTKSELSFLKFLTCGRVEVTGDTARQNVVKIFMLLVLSIGFVLLRRSGCLFCRAE